MTGVTRDFSNRISLCSLSRLASLYGLVPDNEYRVEVVATDNDGESDALSSLARTKADGKFHMYFTRTL